MISLLLTLFISLFSFGSYIYPLENNLSRNSNISTSSTINIDSCSSLPSKRAVELNNGGYLYNLLEFVNRFIESPMRISEFKDLEVNEYIAYNGLYNYMYANYNNMNMGQGNFVIDGVNIGSILGQVKTDGYYWNNSTLPVRDIDYNFYSSATPDENYLIFTITVGYIKTSMAQLEQWSYTQVQIQSLDRTYFVYDSNSAGDVLGLRISQDSGYDLGFTDGYNEGYTYGYTDGLNNLEYDGTALTIFSGIMGIALVPINMFLQIFNFEILGINVSGFISGILTLAVVVIILRLVFGGKKDD